MCVSRLSRLSDPRGQDASLIHPCVLHGAVRGITNSNCPPWPGLIETTCMSYLKQEVLVRNAELTSYHQPGEFGKGQKERGDPSPYVLPTSQNASRGNPAWLSDARGIRKDPESE